MENMAQINESLLESEARYKCMFQDHKSVMLLIEPQTGEIIDANKAALKFYNYTIDELRGMNLGKINTMPPEQFVLAKQKAIKSEQNMFNFSHRLSNGEIREVEVHTSLIKFNHQQLLFSIIDDITDRKLLEEKLKQNEEALKKAEEIGKFGYWQIHLNKKKVFSSNGAGAIYGLTNNEFDLEEIQTISLPEFRPTIDKALVDLINHGLPYDIEYKIQRKTDGAVLTIHSIAEFDIEKNIVFGTIQDITDRKRIEDALRESDEKFRLVIENTRNAILFTEPTGIVTFANPEACRIFGMSIEEFQSNGRNNIVNLNDPRLPVAMKERERTGKFKGELTFIKKDGSIFPGEISSDIFIDSKGIKRASIIINDITKRKQTELFIQKQNIELNKLNTDKDRFISILAHDLKSPFSSILGFLNLLSENIHDYDTAKIEMLINTVNNSAHSVYHLLEDILLWIKSESGYLSNNPQFLNFQNIYLGILEILKPNIATKNISINYTGLNSVLIYADCYVVSTILRNLVSNAIKFTNPGGKIEVSAIRNNSYVTVTVSDNGVGISEDNMKSLFDIGQKHTTRGTTNEEGTGLGLILCKELIEKNGGRIWVDSEVGIGSKFAFTIPDDHT